MRPKFDINSADGQYSLESIRWIVKLFPKLEYMKICVYKTECNDTVRFILSNNNIYCNFRSRILLY